MMLRKYVMLAIAGGALVAALPAVGATPKPAMAAQVKPVVQGQETAKYGGLPVLPSCLSFAVERGNPFTGPSILLIKMQAGCVVPWHWHSVREELMLVSGRGKVEIANFPTHTVRPGGYVLLPARHHHQFGCETDCVFFDAISGKFDIHYIDKSGKEIPVIQALKAVSEIPGASK